MDDKKIFRVQVSTYALVKSTVLVEAESSEGAILLAKNLIDEPQFVFDDLGQQIEGLGDLVWRYEEMTLDSVDAAGGITADILSRPKE